MHVYLSILLCRLHKKIEDMGQKVYKLLKERFSMKYTIISTV